MAEDVEVTEEAPVYLWRVLRFDADAVAAVTRWLEVGVIESEYQYAGPMASVIGPRFGEGRFMLICDGRVVERRVVAEKVWLEADPEAEPDPDEEETVVSVGWPERVEKVEP